MLILWESCHEFYLFTNTTISLLTWILIQILHFLGNFIAPFQVSQKFIDSGTLKSPFLDYQIFFLVPITFPFNVYNSYTPSFGDILD